MTITDQTGHTIDIVREPKRIVSVVPSQTELLYDLGLREEVVGVTRFCIHPEQWRKEKAVVGGTKKLKLDRIRDLKPDLIVANKEENTKRDIESLRKDFPVWTSDIKNLSDAMDMIESLGTITHTTIRAQEMVNTIKQRFASLATQDILNKRTLYLIWKKPYMGVGRDTFIHHMIEAMGLENCQTDELRYPELNDKDILSLHPDNIFLSSEPYPFKEKDMEELRMLCPEARILLVDGEMFSWYGSRLQQSPVYFNELINTLRD